jgi:hypothetical protein
VRWQPLQNRRFRDTRGCVHGAVWYSPPRGAAND